MNSFQASCCCVKSVCLDALARKMQPAIGFLEAIAKRAKETLDTVWIPFRTCGDSLGTVGAVLKESEFFLPLHSATVSNVSHALTVSNVFLGRLATPSSLPIVCGPFGSVAPTFRGHLVCLHYRRARNDTSCKCSPLHLGWLGIVHVVLICLWLSFEAFGFQLEVGCSVRIVCCRERSNCCTSV